MKHWDLVPGETVTLSHSSGMRVRGVFRNRDTRFACIEVGGERKYFLARKDGELEDTFLPGRPRVWQIEGADRHTRTLFDTRVGNRTEWDADRRRTGENSGDA
jgi:hypothetical protein